MLGQARALNSGWAVEESTWIGGETVILAKTAGKGVDVCVVEVDKVLEQLPPFAGGRLISHIRLSEPDRHTGSVTATTRSEVVILNGVVTTDDPVGKVRRPDLTNVLPTAELRSKFRDQSHKDAAVCQLLAGDRAGEVLALTALGQLFRIDLTNRQCLAARPDALPPRQWTSQTGSRSSLRFLPSPGGRSTRRSPLGGYVLVVAGSCGTVRLLDSASLAVISTFLPGATSMAHVDRAAVTALAPLPDGRLALGAGGGRVHIVAPPADLAAARAVEEQLVGTAHAITKGVVSTEMCERVEAVSIPPGAQWEVQVTIDVGAYAVGGLAAIPLPPGRIAHALTHQTAIRKKETIVAARAGAVAPDSAMPRLGAIPLSSRFGLLTTALDSQPVVLNVNAAIHAAQELGIAPINVCRANSNVRGAGWLSQGRVLLLGEPGVQLCRKISDRSGRVPLAWAWSPAVTAKGAVISGGDNSRVAVMPAVDEHSNWVNEEADAAVAAAGAGDDALASPPPDPLPVMPVWYPWLSRWGDRRRVLLWRFVARRGGSKRRPLVIR